MSSRDFSFSFFSFIAARVLGLRDCSQSRNSSKLNGIEAVGRTASKLSETKKQVRAQNIKSGFKY